MREVLKGGFDPPHRPRSQETPLPHGEMHLLPSAPDGAVGVKMQGIQPADSTGDVPLVQGAYLLMDGETLTPEVVKYGDVKPQSRTSAIAVAGYRTTYIRELS